MFSVTEGMAHEATIITKDCLACCQIIGRSLMHQFWDGLAAISFCLLRSAIQCIIEVQSSQSYYIKSAPVHGSDSIRDSVFALVY